MARIIGVGLVLILAAGTYLAQYGRLSLVGAAALADESSEQFDEAQAEDDARHGMQFLIDAPALADESIEQTTARLRDQLDKAQAEYDARRDEWKPYGAKVAALNAKWRDMRDNAPNMRDKNYRQYSQQVHSVNEQLRAALEDERPFARAMERAKNDLMVPKMDWDIWQSMPQDRKAFLKIQRDRCRKGRRFVKRDVLIDEIEKFVAQYPDSTKVPQALFDAACLYTGWVERDKVIATREVEKARVYYERIVDRYPDLLILFTVASRKAIVFTQIDRGSRLTERLNYYRWLLSIGDTQRRKTLEFLRNDWYASRMPEKYMLGQVDGVLTNEKKYIPEMEKGMIEDAIASSDPLGNLDMLRTEFPDSRLARLASAAIEKLGDEPRSPSRPGMMPALPFVPSAATGTSVSPSDVAASVPTEADGQGAPSGPPPAVPGSEPQCDLDGAGSDGPVAGLVPVAGSEKDSSAEGTVAKSAVRLAAPAAAPSPSVSRGAAGGRGHRIAGQSGSRWTGKAVLLTATAVVAAMLLAWVCIARWTNRRRQGSQ